ncbi:MAG TPA: hypothetical protein VFI17_10490 [Solirubrobacterales bacterium]|nr:hypothetical protein [Solirubrobacterales bacterium]
MSSETKREDLPELLFARAKETPPSGSIQFYDGFFPALSAGSKYTIAAKQSLPTSLRKEPYEATQEFEIEAPRFTLDPGVVETVFPPDRGNGEYDQELPFVVLTDPTLPWERTVVPGEPAPTPERPTGWLALAVFAADEIELQPGTGSPVETLTVRALLEGEGGVPGPQIPTAAVPGALLGSSCQAITVKGPAFAAVMPTLAELSSLAHCRAVNNLEEGEALLSVVLANRLPLATGSPVRYFANLVSLEGCHEYLEAGKQVPPKVRLASLHSWSFISQPESDVDFETVVEELIAHQTPTATLSLPPAAGKQLGEPAAARIADGYAPLAFVSGAGEQSFAWYRGPLSPVVPQPLPKVGEPAVPVAEARNADELAIYLAEQGTFDLSYAAAWNAGRQLALADSKFSEAIGRLLREARRTLGQAAQRLSAPHLTGGDPERLLARDATRARFAEAVAGGLTGRWTAALAGARAGVAAPAAAGRLERPRRRASVHPRDALAEPWVAATLGEALEELLKPVGAWLARLSLLGPVPFEHLVPRPAMLPPDSLRFFYLDRDWIDAMLAGATSIGVEAAADAALLATLMPKLAKIVADEGGAGLEGAPRATGVVIRSQLVSAWPSLVVTAEAGGKALPSLRDDCPAPAVRFCLFAGVPDHVTLAEPYRGLRFGTDEHAVAPRYVTSAGPIGKKIPGVKPVAPSFRQAQPAGVLEIAPLAKKLAEETGSGAPSLGAGDLAIQLVAAPEMQTFPSDPSSGR